MDERKKIEYDRIFRALGDKHRLQILDLLMERDMNAGELLELVDVVQSTLSHHMKALCDSGLVIPRRERKWTYYTVSAQTVELAREFLKRYLAADAVAEIPVESEEVPEGSKASEAEEVPEGSKTSEAEEVPEVAKVSEAEEVGTLYASMKSAKKKKPEKGKKDPDKKKGNGKKKEKKDDDKKKAVKKEAGKKKDKKGSKKEKAAEE